MLKRDLKTTSSPIFAIDKVSEVQALGITCVGNKQIIEISKKHQVHEENK